MLSLAQLFGHFEALLLQLALLLGKLAVELPLAVAKPTLGKGGLSGDGWLLQSRLFSPFPHFADATDLDSLVHIVLELRQFLLETLDGHLLVLHLCKLLVVLLNGLPQLLVLNLHVLVATGTRCEV